MHLDKNLSELARLFKLNDSNLGQIAYLAEGIPGFHSKTPLNGEILHFYSHLMLSEKPTFGGGAYLQIFETDELPKILSEWRSPDKNNNWSDDFLIFAERNGDVIYCDLSDEKSPVYGSIQKKKLHISSSLNDFIQAYNRTLEIEIKDFSCDVLDEDFNYKSDYLSTIENELKKTLSTDLSANYMKFFYG